jgi:hypothetical protein
MRFTMKTGLYPLHIWRCDSCVRWIRVGLTMIPPLPKGEGRGEGEGAIPRAAFCLDYH